MVFTNEKCVGCNKCIRSCPVLTANVAENDALLDSIYSMNARVVNIAATKKYQLRVIQFVIYRMAYKVK